MKAKLCATAAQQPPWSLCSPPAPRCISTKKKHTHKKRSCFFACCKRICWILPKASTPFWQSISAGRRNRNSAASCQMKDKKDFFFFLFLFPLFYGIKRPHKKKKKNSEKIFLFVLIPLLLNLQPLCMFPPPAAMQMERMRMRAARCRSSQAAATSQLSCPHSLDVPKFQKLSCIHPQFWSC